jgi:integration host factor subunit alpha
VHAITALWRAHFVAYTSSSTFTPERRIQLDTWTEPSVANKKPPKRKGLTKADLVDVVYRRHGGLTKREATEVVEAIFGAVKTTLGDGRPVKIKNFGTFEITDRPGRVGVNPSSGEKMFIPPHKGLSFRPARRLVRTETKGRRPAADKDES